MLANKILMKGSLISLTHGFEMLDGSIAEGLPKEKKKTYHKIKDFYKHPQK